MQNKFSFFFLILFLLLLLLLNNTEQMVRTNVKLRSSNSKPDELMCSGRVTVHVPHVMSFLLPMWELEENRPAFCRPIICGRCNKNVEKT
jgi:hypothetical protein